MSYILEALKRAQAEREQGHVPGLHAQPLPHTAAPHESRWRLWWIGAVALIAGATLITLLLWKSQVFTAADVGFAGSTAAQSKASSPSVVPAASPPPSPFVVGGTVASVTVTAPQPAPQSAPLPVAAAPVPSSPPPPPVPPPPQAVARPIPQAVPQPVAPPAAKSPVAAAPPAAPKASVPAAPLPTAAASAPVEGSRIYTQAELPEDIRRDLPKLAVSGSVYSSNPAQRMLVLNGQVMQEGGTPGGDVVLEQIRPKSAVLRFRGYRYSLEF